MGGRHVKLGLKKVKERGIAERDWVKKEGEKLKEREREREERERERGERHVELKKVGEINSERK